MLRAAILLSAIVLPLAGCQLAVPVAATQVALPLATSRTVLSGTKQMVEIRTEPPGAKVEIAGYPTRTTPTFIMLARGRSHTVRIVKEGFKPVTTNLTSQRADAALNASNVLGNALDEASGAAWELCPGRLTLTLESDKPGAATAVASAAAVAPAPPVPASSKSAPAAAVATPPFVQRTVPSSTPAASASPTDTAAVLAEQLARLDRLLEQGVITQREHDVLVAAATSAAAVAGVTPSP